MDARQPHIIRFKSKALRSQPVDKTELFRQIIVSAGSWSGAAFLNAKTRRDETVAGRTDRIVLDYDSYTFPLLATDLTPDEVNAFRQHEDVEQVEEDAWAHTTTASSRGVGRNSDGRASLAEQGTGSDVPSSTQEIVPWGVGAVDSVQAWATSLGGGVKVAIIDTGIDGTHPDLVDNVRTGRSFVPGNADATDDNGHGTHCAGTIGAAWNGAGVVGVAPAVELYPVKVLQSSGTGLFGWIGAGVQWAVDAGMDVLSLSLSGPTMPSQIQDVFTAAAAAGKIIVAAAGNEGGAVGYPARLPSCIAVSAIDRAKQLASFSNRGPEIALCAPGVDVVSTWLGGGYRTLSGTSMACPHVSGVAALAVATHRSMSAANLRALLSATAASLPGPPQSFGAGVVNALRAVLT